MENNAHKAVYLTDKFIFLCTFRGEELVSVIGHKAKIEQIEMNVVKVVTGDRINFYDLGAQEAYWLNEEVVGTFEKASRNKGGAIH